MENIEKTLRNKKTGHGHFQVTIEIKGQYLAPPLLTRWLLMPPLMTAMTIMKITVVITKVEKRHEKI